MVLPVNRHWIIAGVVAVVVLAVGGTLAVILSVSRPAAPPDATAAVNALLNGTPDQVRAALSPPLDAELTVQPDQMTGPAVPFELTGWQSDGVFAGATATIHEPNNDVLMDIGFRLVDGTWRITSAQLRPS